MTGRAPFLHSSVKEGGIGRKAERAADRGCASGHTPCVGPLQVGWTYSRSGGRFGRDLLLREENVSGPTRQELAVQDCSLPRTQEGAAVRIRSSTVDPRARRHGSHFSGGSHHGTGPDVRDGRA